MLWLLNLTDLFYIQSIKQQKPDSLLVWIWSIIAWKELKISYERCFVASTLHLLPQCTSWLYIHHSTQASEQRETCSPDVLEMFTFTVHISYRQQRLSSSIPSACFTSRLLALPTGPESWFLFPLSLRFFFVRMLNSRQSAGVVTAVCLFVLLYRTQFF